MSDARRRVDWEEMFSLALDPVKPRKYFESAPPSNEGTCTMCGKMCAVRTVNTIMDGLVIDLGDELGEPSQHSETDKNDKENQDTQAES